ncbi:MAG: hypothetical protein HY928_16960 [Elusimicrobia bacterium]|nr:hypothetical protein [Elusimicrobiota bacterium]
MSGGPVCAVCGYHGAPDRETPGSILIEVVLWCAFIIPGIIYSLWRLTNKKDVCAKCSSPALIPADSPRGRKIIADGQ